METIKKFYRGVWLLIPSLVLGALLGGCEEFLDAKPDQSLVVPTTLADVQSLFDNINVFNEQPTLPMISSEEIWISDEGYAALSNPIEQATFIWDEDPFQGSYGGDWNNVYEQVFYANVALGVLEDFEGSKDSFYEQLLGTAYFLRGYAYLQLVQQFAPPYQKNGGNENLLGIVLKSTPDINEEIERSSLSESYAQIFEDLNKAVTLLPETASPKTRPTKAAALGALARAFLNTFQYGEAAASAATALEIYQDRLDFNEIDVDANRPFKRFDEETVFYSTLLSYSFLRSNQVFADSTLMELYEPGDLRRAAYFDLTDAGTYNYTGKLSGATQNFGGLSVGELYLMAAEGYVRSGDDKNALGKLNGLLELRYENGSWQPIEGLEGDGLLEKILEERRKELFGRGLRWMDLRRLNQEGAGIELHRRVNGQSYTLEPNSVRYTFPIPLDEISRSGISQNPR